MQIDDSLQLALVPIDVDARNAPAADTAGRPAGPGWFDSSWDLRRGLEVRELERADGWPAQRPLRVVALRTSSRTASPSSITASA